MTVFSFLCFRIFNKDNVRITDKGTRLKITGVTTVDNGIYSCRAENVAGAVDSMSNYILNVQGEGFYPP